MPQPTAYEKAMLVAQCAAGIMQSYESWRAYGEEKRHEDTFEDWATRRAFRMAKGIFSRISEKTETTQSDELR